MVAASGIVFGLKPRPTRGQVRRLSFELAEATTVSLTVLDAMGRTLYARQFEGSQGMNRILLNKEWGTTGSSVLYYRLETNTANFVRKMICIGG